MSAATLGLGSVLLRRSLSAPSGSGRFLGNAAALAATWTLGGLATRDPRAGADGAGADGDHVREAALGAGAAVALIGVFAAGGAVAVRLPAVRRAIGSVLRHERQGSGPLVAVTAIGTGVAEEVFFRGGLPDRFRRHPVLGPTLAYVAVTTVSGNPMLVLASALLGTVTGALRARTGGLLAPVVAHAGWSAGMLVLLPRLLRSAERHDETAGHRGNASGRPTLHQP